VKQNDKTAISESKLSVFLFQHSVFGISNQRRFHGTRIKQINFRIVIRLSHYNAVACCDFDASKISGFEFKIMLIGEDKSTLQITKGGNENISAFFIFLAKLIRANLCLENRFV